MLIKKSKREERELGGFRRGRGWVVSFPSTLSFSLVCFFLQPFARPSRREDNKSLAFFWGLINQRRTDLNFYWVFREEEAETFKKEGRQWRKQWRLGIGVTCVHRW
ncbi:Uncharacterized protein Rs2_11372 [Raphanus sativus]|nr:Uncharacterized protein Rs2_11372 [Raphanus sativus]